MNDAMQPKTYISTRLRSAFRPLCQRLLLVQNHQGALPHRLYTDVFEQIARDSEQAMIVIQRDIGLALQGKGDFQSLEDLTDYLCTNLCREVTRLINNIEQISHASVPAPLENFNVLIIQGLSEATWFILDLPAHIARVQEGESVELVIPSTRLMTAIRVIRGQLGSTSVSQERQSSWVNLDKLNTVPGSSITWMALCIVGLVPIWMMQGTLVTIWVACVAFFLGLLAHTKDFYKAYFVTGTLGALAHMPIALLSESPRATFFLVCVCVGMFFGNDDYQSKKQQQQDHTASIQYAFSFLFGSACVFFVGLTFTDLVQFNLLSVVGWGILASFLGSAADEMYHNAPSAYIDELEQSHHEEWTQASIRHATSVAESKQSERSRYIRKSVRDDVWRRDQGRCVECGTKENLEYDHIIPFSKGGANTYRNLQLLCQACNRRKGDQIG